MKEKTEKLSTSIKANIEDNLRKIIRKVIKKEGLQDNQFAASIETSSSNLSHFLSGKNKNRLLGAGSIGILIHKYGVNPNEIFVQNLD